MSALIIRFPIERIKPSLSQDLLLIDQAYLKGEITAEFAEWLETEARQKRVGAILVGLQHRWGAQRVRRHISLIQRAVMNTAVEY